MMVGARRGRLSRDAVYAQLAEGVEELRDRLGGLPSPIEAEDIWGDIWYQEAHNSTAIEGNVRRRLAWEGELSGRRVFEVVFRPAGNPVRRAFGDWWRDPVRGD